MINKPFKLKSENYDQILFTSDQHYGHNRDFLYGKRNFKNVEEHDKWLNAQYLKVSANSLIISLGDPALNCTPDKLLEFFNKTSAPIWHIFGNHFSNDYALYREGINTYNWLHSMQKEPLIREKPLEYEIYPFTINRIKTKYIFENVCANDKLSLLPGKCGLTNYPPYTLTFLGNSADISIDNQLIHLTHMAPLIWTRHSWCLFGHSHGGLRGAQPNDKESGKWFDCGVENSIEYNGTAFFSWTDIKHIMHQKNDKTEDVHL
jgi:calcineurin-like phosphoesterase family protein